jgi:hypothetical protein
MAAKPVQPSWSSVQPHHHRYHDDTGDGETQRDQVDDGEIDGRRLIAPVPRTTITWYLRRTKNTK